MKNILSKASKALLNNIVLILIIFTSNLRAQNFNISQVPLQDNLADSNNFGFGLSMALDNDLPNFSAYSEQGHLLFVEQVNGQWIFSTVAEDVVNIGLSDEYRTSLIFVDHRPYIAYYDGVSSELKLATRSDNIWTISTVASNNVGSFAAARLLQAGQIRICYLDRGNSDLKVSTGEPNQAMNDELVDSAGGEWCSFLADNIILYSVDGAIKRADYQNGSWNTVSTNVSGTQPSGGIHSNGATEFYASQNKNSWGLGASDNLLNYYYRADAESDPNTGTYEVGAFPAFLAGTGFAFRKLTYSALFGNFNYILANIIEEGGMYSYSINAGSGCLPDIRYLNIAKASNGGVYIAFYYSVNNCYGESKTVVQLAYKAAHVPPQEDDDNQGDPPPEESPDEDDDQQDPPADDNQPPPDNDDGEDSDNLNSLEVNSDKQGKNYNFLIAANVRSGSSCQLSVETSGKNNFSKLLASKNINLIQTSADLNYVLSVKSKIKSKFYLRYKMICDNDQLNINYSDHFRINLKGSRRFSSKLLKKQLQQFLNKNLRSLE